MLLRCLCLIMCVYFVQLDWCKLIDAIMQYVICLIQHRANNMHGHAIAIIWPNMCEHTQDISNICNNQVMYMISMRLNRYIDHCICVLVFIYLCYRIIIMFAYVIIVSYNGKRDEVI